MKQVPEFALYTPQAQSATSLVSSSQGSLGILRAGSSQTSYHGRQSIQLSQCWAVQNAHKNTMYIFVHNPMEKSYQDFMATGYKLQGFI